MSLMPRKNYGGTMGGKTRLRRGRKPGLNYDELDAIDNAIAKLSGPSRTNPGRGELSNHQKIMAMSRLTRKRQRIIADEGARSKSYVRRTSDADLEEYY